MKICDPIIHTAMRGAVKIFAAIVLLSFCVRFAYAETTETIYYKEGVRQSATATTVSGSTTRWGEADREEQWYVVQGRVDIPARVTVSGNVHLILSDGAELLVTGGIRLAGDNALTIYGQEEGTGRLSATSLGGNAGIGGNGIKGERGEPGGCLTIYGGTVQAYAPGSDPASGAGIGGGGNPDGIGGSGGIVYIYGGSVSASGGGFGGSGIGGGGGQDGGAGGSITIAGGNVTALGGKNGGSGLGGGKGRTGGSGGEIAISGGTLKAVGGENAAAIGGGGGSTFGGSGGRIIISGGTIEATGGQSGAGLGGGGAVSATSSGGSGGEITISGGKLKATGGENAAAIGGGYGQETGGSSGNISISGGSITAIAGEKLGSGLGGGGGFSKIGGSGERIIISGGTIEAIGSEKGAGIGGGGSNRKGGSGGEIILFGGSITATNRADSGPGGEGIGGGKGSAPTADASGTFRTDNGDPLILAKSIQDQSDKKNWSGILFEGDRGTVYGDRALQRDLVVSSGKTLTVPENTTLTVSGANRLTVDGDLTVNGLIINNGTLGGGGTLSGDGKIINKGRVDFSGAASPEMIRMIDPPAATVDPANETLNQNAGTDGMIHGSANAGVRPSPAILPSTGSPEVKRSCALAALQSIDGAADTKRSDRLTDIASHWAKRNIEYVVERGIMVGTSGDKFSPERRTDQAMLVTVLSRMSGQESRYPSSGYGTGQNTYYEQALGWAVHSGILRGIEFQASAPITREQTAIMIGNFIRSIDIKLPLVNEGKPFTDTQSIREDAREAVALMQRTGIMNGKDGNYFDPKGLTTRAELAAILQRLIVSATKANL